MMWLRKSKKGFTLIELMVVVAIIGILALLGLRLFLMQQIRAKNAIVKANAATVHTIIQGNLADTDYSSTDADSGNDTGTTGSDAAVEDIRDQNGVILTGTGEGFNSDRPAGMKNPHLTDTTDLVVKSVADVDADFTGSVTTYAGVVVVMEDATVTNRFYVRGLDNDADRLGEKYVATK